MYIFVYYCIFLYISVILFEKQTKYTVMYRKVRKYRGMYRNVQIFTTTYRVEHKHTITYRNLQKNNFFLFLPGHFNQSEFGVLYLSTCNVATWYYLIRYYKFYGVFSYYYYIYKNLRKICFEYNKMSILKKFA